mgnify:CR=1 FL=1
MHGWPASPLSWFSQSLTALSEADATGLVRSKSLAGLNFYGMRYTHGAQSQPVLGRDLVATLQQDAAAVAAVKAGTAIVVTAAEAAKVAAAAAKNKSKGKGRGEVKTGDAVASGDLKKVPSGAKERAAMAGLIGGGFKYHATSGEHYYQRPLFTTAGSEAETGTRTEAGNLKSAATTVYTLTGESEYLWYPSLHSVAARVKAAQKADAAGVAVWDCGQGLDYFFDLL